MNIYVGNLPYSTTDDDLREAFSSHGQVDDVRIIFDRYTERSKGFGFVDMPDDDEAKKAISELEGKEIEGRALRVNEARPKEDRGGGGDRQR